MGTHSTPIARLVKEEIARSRAAFDPLIDNNPAADVLGIAHGTLPVWRATKRYDLPYVKIGRRVKYRMSDLLRFIESRIVPGDGSPAPKARSRRKKAN
jgi:hypothetical protein